MTTLYEKKINNQKNLILSIFGEVREFRVKNMLLYALVSSGSMHSLYIFSLSLLNPAVFQTMVPLFSSSSS